ncbi:MAG: hypothetical protein AAFR87_10770 [Bacteroidota bacterium]
MKRSIFTLLIATLALSLSAQINDIEVRIGGDLWRVAYTNSVSQINCGLCPQLIGEIPDAQNIIFGLQDSVSSTAYVKGGANFSIGASFIIPALHGELQIGPSMRQLSKQADRIGRYANRNISLFVGLNPMEFSEFAGKYYLGENQQLFLDFSDLGVYAQFSYDGGFEEFVRSTNNLAVLVRAQPTLWLNSDRKVGVYIRGGARTWLMGNTNANGPFLAPNGLPKKVRPKGDWFVGMGIKIRAF